MKDVHYVDCKSVCSQREAQYDQMIRSSQFCRIHTCLDLIYKCRGHIVIGHRVLSCTLHDSQRHSSNVRKSKCNSKIHATIDHTERRSSEPISWRVCELAQQQRGECSVAVAGLNKLNCQRASSARSHAAPLKDRPGTRSRASIGAKEFECGTLPARTVNNGWLGSRDREHRGGAPDL